MRGVGYDPGAGLYIGFGWKIYEMRPKLSAASEYFHIIFSHQICTLTHLFETENVQDYIRTMAYRNSII